MIKNKQVACDTSPLSWNEKGRPSQRDMVKNAPKQIERFGYSTWEGSRPGKQSIKGRGQG